jgi:hypothetical protein
METTKWRLKTVEECEKEVKLQEQILKQKQRELAETRRILQDAELARHFICFAY